MEWKGTVVLITGASSGIGEATALELAAAGAIPVLVARRAAELERVAADVRSRVPGGELTWLAADITVAADREAIRGHIAERFGRLDVLINNAGITAHGRFDESDLSVLRSAMELNFFATVELTALLLPLIKGSPRRDRRIMLVSTPSGLYGVPGRFAYSASKAAGHAWMETIRQELKADGIHTVIFCPGYTRTNLRTSGLAADGTRLVEAQAAEAKSPEWMARKLKRALESRRRIVPSGFQGHALYWLRTLAPGLLEWSMSKKLRGHLKKKL
jgi:NAD(P)-dependent dehydrogenase (short-subunit alcohol dehydrogenase family)